jgi:alkyl sulfatase BDS1-like metallo-beta-lactamase superfamily hydrolase
LRKIITIILQLKNLEIYFSLNFNVKYTKKFILIPTRSFLIIFIANPAHLKPGSEIELANHWVKLCGSLEKLVDYSLLQLKNKNYAVACHMVKYLEFNSSGINLIIFFR